MVQILLIIQLNKEEIMLHINKFKFGLEEKRNLQSMIKKKFDDINFNLIRFPFGKISKKETKILATIGPKSCSINSIYNISKFTNFFRINGSHNSMEWHIKISKRIKEICPESFILLDIPGLKPRTNNLKDIQIKKNQMVKFVFGKQDNEEGVLSIHEQATSDLEISKGFTQTDRKLLNRIYDAVVGGGASGGYKGGRKRALPSLGALPSERFFKISLPLARPAVAAPRVAPQSCAAALRPLHDRAGLRASLV